MSVCTRNSCHDLFLYHITPYVSLLFVQCIYYCINMIFFFRHVWSKMFWCHWFSLRRCLQCDKAKAKSLAHCWHWSWCRWDVLIVVSISWGVSKNNGTSKSSILIGFSIINHPFWGTPIFGNIHIHEMFVRQAKLICNHPVGIGMKLVSNHGILLIHVDHACSYVTHFVIHQILHISWLHRFGSRGEVKPLLCDPFQLTPFPHRLVPPYGGEAGAKAKGVDL